MRTIMNTNNVCIQTREERLASQRQGQTIDGRE